MGKYQLDSKGQANINKFHEKHSTLGGKTANPQKIKEQKIEELRRRMKKNDKKA